MKDRLGFRTGVAPCIAGAPRGGRRFAARAWFLACALGMMVSATDSDSADPSGALADRLRRSGRAETRFARTTLDLLSGEPVKTAGLLVLEIPDRASLAFTPSGERITLRNDGGEWLQPALRQMIRLGPGYAAQARTWWDVLLGRGETQRHLADGRILLLVGEAADSAFVSLDATGLPVRLAFDDGGQRQTFDFSGWRFTGVRGEPAFRIAPPKGYEVVELP